MTAFRALLLDWYGTLACNPRPEAEVEAAKARGLARALNGDGRLAGLDADEVWRRYRWRLGELAAAAAPAGRHADPAAALALALGECGVPVDEAEARRVSCEAYVGDPELGVRLFEDTVGALERAASLGLRLALVSNREHGLEVFAGDLSRLGVGGFFDSVVVSADVGFAKPHPEPFRRALRELGAAPEEAVMAGDEPVADVRGAQGAGLAAVWLRRDGASPGAVDCRPYAEVASLGELLDRVS